MRGQIGWRGALLLVCGVGVGMAAVLAIGPHHAFAEGNPFGGPRAVPESGVIGWILAKQAEFYRALSGLIRSAKTDGSAVWGLFGVSFLYGVFHAAGPGHGKAVISSYLVANEETWKRGVTLSFASALLQALVAVLLVGIAAAALGATAKMMGDTVRVIETASYALIAAFGARLTWIKGREFLSAWRAERSASAHTDHAHHHPGHDHGSDQHDLRQDHRHDAECHHRHDHAGAGGPGQVHAHHDHGHDKHHGHDHHNHTGHAHGPEPQELAGPGGWQRGLTAIVAVGLRPCSGAILVLVFALAQGLFWAGVVSTFIMGLGTALTVAAIATLAVAAKGVAGRIAAHREGAGALALRGIEAGAAVLVLVFGLALLAGYMASERIVGF